MVNLINIVILVNMVNMVNFNIDVFARRFKTRCWGPT